MKRLFILIVLALAGAAWFLAHEGSVAVKAAVDQRSVQLASLGEG
jgi:hypothetical protein